MKSRWVLALAATLALAGAADAQQPPTAQVAQPPTAQVTQRVDNRSCIGLSGHAYVVQMTGYRTGSTTQVRVISWMRFMPDGTGSGSILAIEGSGYGGSRSFTIQCTSSAGWSASSPMGIIISNVHSPGGGTGGVQVDGAYSLLIAEGGQSFAIMSNNTTPTQLSGWGRRQ